MNRTTKVIVICVSVAVCATLLLLAILIAAAIALPAVQQAREAARREEVRQNLRQLGEAIRAYQERTGNLQSPESRSPASE
jgi:type II secretory pathway pseudopilin PulG